MNEKNLIVENERYEIINVNNKSIAIVPKDFEGKLDVIVDLEKGIQSKDYIISNQKEKLFEQESVKDLIETGSNKNIYLIPLIDSNLLNVSVGDGSSNRDGNYNIVFGAIGSIISEPVLDTYIEKKEERPIRILLNDESIRVFCNWLETNKEVPGHNFVEGISKEDWKNKVISERVILEQVEKSENLNIAVENVSVEPNGSVVLPNEIGNDSESNFTSVDSIASVNGNNSVQQVVENNNLDNGVVQSSNQSIPSEVGQGSVIQNNDTNAETVLQTPVKEDVEVSSTPVGATGSKMGSLARAGFVKFPVFLLTIMAIGALGIFVGKMFYTYLSQQ